MTWSKLGVNAGLQKPRTTVYEDGTSISTDLTESEYASTTSGANS